MRATLIRQVVAVDHRQHNVVHIPLFHGLGNVLGLLGIQRWRCPRGGNGTKSATTRACVAHDHHRSRARRPTLSSIRAAGFFAHRRQAGLLDGGPNELVPLGGLRVRVRVEHLQPRRFANSRWPRNACHGRRTHTAAAAAGWHEVGQRGAVKQGCSRPLAGGRRSIGVGGATHEASVGEELRRRPPRGQPGAGAQQQHRRPTAPSTHSTAPPCSQQRRGNRLG
mmetsp:Transcript_71663/g.181005  ORF Transcript_71663/g.181005 Transcript_71663/m.181005 type:complete len:223 (+) Transcript_71663:870-1538(+)